MWNVKEQEIRRRSDGSIDSDYYVGRARKLRTLAFRQWLAGGNRWLLRQAGALVRLVKRAPLRTTNHSRNASLKNVTLYVPDGGARVSLSRDGLIRVQDGAGFRIRCHSGSLWITQEQGGADVVLQSGDAFVLDRPGLTLVTALLGGELSVEHPRTASVVCTPKKSRVPIDDSNFNYARA